MVLTCKALVLELTFLPIIKLLAKRGFITKKRIASEQSVMMRSEVFLKHSLISNIGFFILKKGVALTHRALYSGFKTKIFLSDMKLEIAYMKSLNLFRKFVKSLCLF